MPDPARQFTDDLPRVPAAELRARRGALFHAGRTFSQADLFELTWQGRPALLKDFGGRPAWVRRLWGRAVLAREVRVLAALQGVPGVPALWALDDLGEAFVMERLPGVRLPHRNEAPPPPEFWRNARVALEAMHARGVAHGDLRRKNILQGPNGEAYLIDFATAMKRSPAAERPRSETRRGSQATVRVAGGNPISNLFYRRCRRIDRVTFARIKASYSPELLDDEERAWLDSAPIDLRIGRWFRRYIYRLRKPAWWRDRWRKAGRWWRRRGAGDPR